LTRPIGPPPPLSVVLGDGGQPAGHSSPSPSGFAGVFCCCPIPPKTRTRRPKRLDAFCFYKQRSAPLALAIYSSESSALFWRLGPWATALPRSAFACRGRIFCARSMNAGRGHACPKPQRFGLWLLGRAKGRGHRARRANHGGSSPAGWPSPPCSAPLRMVHRPSRLQTAAIYVSKSASAQDRV